MLEETDKGDWLMHTYEDLGGQFFSWAESYLQRVPAYSLADLDYPWAPYLYESLVGAGVNELLGIPPLGGFLLTGPYGSGRHTTGMAIAGDLGKSEACNFIWISGEEIAVDPAATRNRVRALFDLTKKYGNICYLIDGLEGCEQAYSMMGWIADDARHAQNHAYLVVVCEDETKVNPRLRSMLELCVLHLPNEAQRIRFFELELEKGMGLPIAKGMAPQFLARSTEGFHYYQLNTCMRYLRTALLKKIPPANRKVGVMESYIKNNGIRLNLKDFYDCLNMVKTLKKTVESVQTGAFAPLAFEETAEASRAEASQENTTKHTANPAELEYLSDYGIDANSSPTMSKFLSLLEED